MGITRTKNIISGYHKQNQLSVSTGFNTSAQTIYKQYEPAQVIDIILSQKHQQYKSQDDIGKVLVRTLYKQQNNNHPVWAFPMYANIKTYPILHQIVMVSQQVGLTEVLSVGGQLNQTVLYYDNVNPLNIYNNKHSNPMINLSQGIQRKYLHENEQVSYGETFVIQQGKTIQKLLPKQGDTIIQSRYNSNIRLSSTNNSPCVIISNISQSDQTIIEQNINDSNSYIYITSDTNFDVPLLLSTNRHYSLFKSEFNKKFNGSQIILSSGRLVLDSKQKQIDISAKTYVNISAQSQIGIQSEDIQILADNTLSINSGDTVAINSQKIYLCDIDNQNNQLVKGKQLLQILRELIQQIANITIISSSPGSPSSSPTNRVNFTRIANKLKNILSQHIYIK